MKRLPYWIKFAVLIPFVLLLWVIIRSNIASADYCTSINSLTPSVPPSSDNSVTSQVENTDELELMYTRSFDFDITDIAFNSEDKLLIASSDGEIATLDTTDTEAQISFSLLDSSAFRLIFSADGSHAASPIGRIINLWDTETREVIVTIAVSDYVGPISLSADGSLLSYGTDNGHIFIWNAETRETVRVSARNITTRLAFNQSGDLLGYGTVGDNDSIGNVYVGVIDVNSGREHNSFEGHDWSIESLAFSPNGTVLASGSSDNTIRLWDICTNEELGVLRGHTSQIDALAFSADGSLLVAGDLTDIRLWNVEERQEIGRLDSDMNEIEVAVFNRDSTLLAVLDRQNTIQVWSLPY